MASLARRWLAEMQSGSEENPVALEVTMMNFFAPPVAQWTFLETAVALAESENALIAIAAGPFEHLLGHHGDDFIGPVEEKAERDPKFAAMIRNSWRYMMSDEVWARVQAIQAKAVPWQFEAPSGPGS